MRLKEPERGVMADMKFSLRSDMAIEFAKKSGKFSSHSGVKKTEVMVDSTLSARLKRPEGRYVTLESRAPLAARRDKYGALIDEMSEVIRSLAKESESFLAVGVGNPLLTADALGARTVALLKTNRGMTRRHGERMLAAFSPGVSGVTGIESVDFVSSITSLVKPDCVIMIDSLASASVTRLGTAFQLCDSGLVPGSGVGAANRPLSPTSLNVKKTISVGVPLVVYAETIIRDALGEDLPVSDDVRGLLVTPKDVDLIMSECAHIIAESVNSALGL